MNEPILQRMRSWWPARRRSRSERIERPRLATPPSGARVVCITSGKGGTGKSLVSTNLAIAAARRHDRVALVDADLGLANDHLLLGVNPRGHLLHLLEADRDVSDLLTPTPYGFQLLSGGSGVHELAALAPGELFRLIRKLERMRKSSDFVIVDTSAGIGPQTLMFLYACREIVLVVTPDLSSMTDGYAIIKTLLHRSPDFRIRVLVNRVRSHDQARRVFDKIRHVCDRFLSTETERPSIEWIGFLREDPLVSSAAMLRRPVLDVHPDAPVSRGLSVIADRLLDSGTPSLELPFAIRRVLEDAMPDRSTEGIRHAARRHPRRTRSSLTSALERNTDR